MVSPVEKTLDVQDGRVARGLRTRESILQAYEELIAESETPPTGAQVAERAGVSARSIFTHFGDMSGVLAAAIQRSLEWAVATHMEIAQNAPLDVRLDRFCRRQAEVLERTVPLYRVFRSLRQGQRRGELLSDATFETVDRSRRAFLDHVFEPELSRLDPVERAEISEVLIVNSCWATWEAYRAAQGLEPDRARALMEHVFRALLRP